MSTVEPNDEDVLLINTGLDFVGGKAFTCGQLRAALKDRFAKFTTNGVELSGEGISCQYLDANAGGGWKKGKVRLRVDFILDEPEPDPDSSALAPLPEPSDVVLSPNSEQ